MTTQRIKDRAPEGATHYDIGLKHYLKNDGGWFCWNATARQWVALEIKPNYPMTNIKPL